MDLNEYVEYFNKDTELTKKDLDFVILEITAIDNKEDREWEFSIEWECMENDEKGEIKGINTSSMWALKSCYWIVESDDENTS